MEATTPSLYGDMDDGARGAGGKFRKQARKPPATPYDRPPAIRPSRGGWLTRFVDPACRLISSGATKILPSFFSGPPSPPLLPVTMNQDKSTAKTSESIEDDDVNFNYVTSRTTEEAGPSEVADKLQTKYDGNELGQDEQKNLGDSEISRIEQLMKEKLFSRDEIGRLVEILNSRAVESSGPVREKRKTSSTPVGDTGVLVAHDLATSSIERNKEDVDRALPGSSTPFLPTNVQDEVSASPVDIARAYMGSRILDQGTSPYSVGSKDEKIMQHRDEYALNPFIPSSPCKSSTCWPGAMVQDQRAYVTPLSQREKYGFHDFPRTPYSRTIFSSKSRAKLTQLQADNRHPNNSPNVFQRARTPIYGQVRSKGDLLDNGGGSVGPIRRIRNKYASETRSRGSIFLNSSMKAYLPSEKRDGSKGLPTTEKNMEPDEPSSSSKYWHGDKAAFSSNEATTIPNPSTSEAVRKILEHLDRHLPTPQEKAAELKLATSWRKSPHAEVPGAKSNENISLSHLGESVFRRNTDLMGLKFPAKRDNGEENMNFQVKSPERSVVEAKHAIDASAKVSSLVSGDVVVASDVKMGPSFGSKCTSDSQISTSQQMSFEATSNGQQGTNPRWPLSNGEGVATVSNKLPQFTFGTKPNLPSIAIKKPNFKGISSDNGIGFTFPVSAPPSSLLEPPTPSIMPTSSAAVISQPKELPAVPAYTFGSNKSTPPLVFSFPSTSSPNHAGSEDVKFFFGSSTKRLCFSSVGSDAICC